MLRDRTPSCSSSYLMPGTASGENKILILHLACFQSSPHLHWCLDKWSINKLFSVRLSCLSPNATRGLNLFSAASELEKQTEEMKPTEDLSRPENSISPYPPCTWAYIFNSLIMQSSGINRMARSILWASVQNQLGELFPFPSVSKYSGVTVESQNKEVWGEKLLHKSHRWSAQNYAVINILAGDINRTTRFLSGGLSRQTASSG